MPQDMEVRFNFFQVIYNNQNSHKLPYILDSQLSIDMAHRYSPHVSGAERVLLDKTMSNQGYKAWLFANKRMHGLPRVLHGDGSQESLNLDEDAGLGEPTALACEPTGTVAAIQCNRHALTIAAITDMVNHFDGQAQIEFVPILDASALNRLTSDTILKKLRVKVAGFNTFEKLTTYGLSVADAMSLQSWLEAPTLDITWSVGRIMGTGLTQKIRDLLQALLKYVNEQPEQHDLNALNATIQFDADGQTMTEAIDFLAERLYYSAHIPMNLQRELDEDALLDSACKALLEKQNELRNYLPAPQNN